jgi:alkyl hydroperoxide reductase subunit AhpC
MLLFYSGIHGPIYAKYLKELEKHSSEFASRGVNIIAVSTDTKERVIKMAEKINASGVKVAYGMSLQNARDWVFILVNHWEKYLLVLMSPRYSVSQLCI